jgi:hypothetical protein
MATGNAGTFLPSGFSFVGTSTLVVNTTNNAFNSLAKGQSLLYRCADCGACAPGSLNFAIGESSVFANYNPATIVTISGVSAADTTVAVTTDTVISAGGGSLTLGRFTGSLDGTFVQLADGSVFKTSTASAVLGGSIGGDDQLIGSSANDTLRGLGPTTRLQVARVSSCLEAIRVTTPKSVARVLTCSLLTSLIIEAQLYSLSKLATRPRRRRIESTAFQ